MNWYATIKQSMTEHYYPQLISTLNKYRGKGLWLHFSDVPKLGVKTDPSHHDPIGFYFFPLDHIADDPTRYSHWAFRPYMFVCQITPRKPVNLATMQDEEVNQHLQNLNIPREVGRPPTGYQPSPGRDMWTSIENHVQNTEKNQRGRYNVPFRRKIMELGIDALIDNGSATIHSNEPNQMVVLDPSIIKIVEMVQNTSARSRNTSDDDYYRNPKYPFYGKNTRPAIEILNTLGQALGMTVSNLKGFKKGQWAGTGRDGQGNEMRFNITLQRSHKVDYKSFRAKFYATWFSNGKNIYVPEWKGNAPQTDIEFETSTPYPEIVAPFVQQIRETLQKYPIDSRSFVQEPLAKIAQTLGGKAEPTNPISGTVRCQIQGNSLSINLNYDDEVKGYKVGGRVVFKPNSFYKPIDPSFGQYMETPYIPEMIPGKMLADIAAELESIMEKHFREDDSYRGAENEYARQQMTTILQRLRSSGSPL